MDIVVSDVKYTVTVKRTGDASFDLVTNGGPALAASVREQPDGTLLASYGGISHQLTGQEEPLGLRIIVDGATVFVPAAFDPSEIRSDVTGKIVRWLKEDGESVEKGETFAEVEAMKMIMPFVCCVEIFNSCFNLRGVVVCVRCCALHSVECISRRSCPSLS